MNPTAILGALIEAWQEVRIQKARVILSLVGVVAAVAAMSTVMALGDIIVQANKEEIEAMTGRDATIQITVSQAGTDESDPGDGSEGPGGSGSQADAKATSSDLENSPPSPAQLANMEKMGWPAADASPSPFTRATEALASRYALTGYSRSAQTWATFDEVTKAANSGHFRGHAIDAENLGSMVDDLGNSSPYVDVTIQAVDPSYATIYRLRQAAGRWIEPGDVNQRITPVVINEAMHRQALGGAPIGEPIVLTMTGTATKVKIVGVVKSGPYAASTMYVPYDAWELATAGTGKAELSDTSLYVWVDPAQAEQARKELPAAMNSLLGSKWKAEAADPSVWLGEDPSGEDSLGGVQAVIMAIGAIVILLGALGLLNVAIVTVRQRIREIGIRRAVGASARRVFFSVFLESVVATFVAGFLGVALAIVIVRFIPLGSMGIHLQDTPGFPMHTALAAMGISTAIGALAGVIPAAMAVRVKPIDAIRY